MNAALEHKWLETPPAQWSQCLNLTGWQPGSRYDTNHASTWAGLASQLTAIAQRATMLAEYIETRQGIDGCGEKSHTDAVKAANRQLIKVRKAMGFSYPDRGIIQF